MGYRNTATQGAGDIDNGYRGGATHYSTLDVATQAEAEAGVNNEKAMTPLRVAQAILHRLPTSLSQLTDDLGVITSLPTSALNRLGLVKPDGTTTSVDDDGTIHSLVGSTIPVDQVLNRNSSQAISNSAVTIAIEDINDDLDDKADESDIPTNLSDLTDDLGVITSIPVASTSVSGTIMVDGVTANIVNGVLVIQQPESYSLPTASNSQLGGVKVGNGLAIDANGVLSVSLTNASGVDF